MSEPESSCERCTDLRQVVRISSLRKLQMAHRVVMGNLADKTIHEVESPTRAQRAAIVRNLFGVEHDPDPTMPDFESLLTQEHLPDSIHYFFRCSSCGLLFQLFVNTYHGSGGEWRPVHDEDLV